MNKVHWKVKLFRQKQSAWTLICSHKDTGKIGKVLVSTPSSLPPQFKELKRWKEVSLSEISYSIHTEEQINSKASNNMAQSVCPAMRGTVRVYIDWALGVLAEETPAHKCVVGRCSLRPSHTLTWWFLGQLALLQQLFKYFTSFFSVITLAVSDIDNLRFQDALYF